MTEVRAIAIDFDGCLCHNRWPEIGEPYIDVIEAAKAERASGTKLILWTCRCGELLEEAVDWCAGHGLVFDAVNEQVPELLNRYGTDSRKVFAEEYWDDRAKRMPDIERGWTP
jgi:hypothetical protein